MVLGEAAAAPALPALLWARFTEPLEPPDVRKVAAELFSRLGFCLYTTGHARIDLC